MRPKQAKPAADDQAGVAAEPHLNPVRRAQDADHSVWDEPALSPEQRATAPAGRSFADRWERGRAAWWGWRSWLLMLALALSAGPISIGMAFVTNTDMQVSGEGLLLLIAFGPAVEEIAKVAALLWVIELRPWRLMNRVQILVTAIAGGLVFAAIENIYYLDLVIKDPSAHLRWFRWTVCTLLHTGCSAIMGLGLARTWLTAANTMRDPDIGTMTPFMVAAIGLHGGYNALAVFTELTLQPF